MVSYDYANFGQTYLTLSTPIEYNVG